MAQDRETCVIVGAGGGLSASLARLFNAENMSIVLAARDIQKLEGLKEEINCDWCNAMLQKLIKLKVYSLTSTKFQARHQL